MQLNTYVQCHRVTLRWEYHSSGPKDMITWTASAIGEYLIVISSPGSQLRQQIVNDIEYGRGSGLSKSIAKENAAEMALRKLGEEYGD